jgi:competence protein ComEC
LKDVGKRNREIIMIIVLIMYMGITGFSPSVVRATLMCVLALFANMFYRKSDIWQNLSFSLLVLLMYNPFLIENLSVIFSFIGTIGIVWTYRKIEKILEIKRNERKIIDILIVSVSVNILIWPITAFYFNKVYIFSFFTSILVEFIISIVFLCCLIFIFFYKILDLVFLKNLLIKFIERMLSVVLKITNLSNSIRFNYIYIPTPTILSIGIYYVCVFLLLFVLNIYKEKRPNMSKKRVKNLLSLFKYRFNQNNNKFLMLIIVFFIIFKFLVFDSNSLKVYFIDVGQGDSTLIVTPNNQSVLIDGGGSEFGDFDVGKQILLPYLLDRGISKIDYIIISHFDSDHVRWNFNYNGRIKGRRDNN